MILPLAQKLALVTGASRGIGAAIARRLAADGATVIVHYHTGAGEAAEVVASIQRAGGRAEAVTADLSQTSGPAQLLAAMDRAFGGELAGRIDVLVNNAGTVDVDSLMEATDESFDLLFNLNVRAVFQLSREAARRMTKARAGRIINIGSAFGEATPTPGLGIYCGSKFAVRGFTRAWSRDLGPFGVTINAIQPAVIQPDPTPTSGPIFEAMKRFTSAGRFGQPAEVANAVAFLASPGAAFINGESLTIDGGWNA